jgi:hypothetical protein
MTFIAPINGRAGISGNGLRTWPRSARVLAIVLLCICVLAAPLEDASGQSSADRAVVLVDIKGAIGFVAASQLTKALERATVEGSPVVIVRLDTPGGLLSKLARARTKEELRSIGKRPLTINMDGKDDRTR